MSIVYARKKVYRNNLKFYIYVCMYVLYIYILMCTHTHTQTQTHTHTHTHVSLVAQLVKNPPAMQEILVEFLGQEDHLEKG